MLAQPRKRHRSTSPLADELTSPLDILLKRRRREAHFENDDFAPHIPSPTSAYDYRTSDTGGESSSANWTRLVEKRRTRQWEQLNAPQRSSQQSQSSQSYTLDHEPSSPLRPKSYSQPIDMPAPGPMSSSPIQHHPPSSSPFRPSQVVQYRSEEHMDDEEMRREWGAEYYNQNSLLHQLHMTRTSGHEAHLIPMPDSAMLQTPSINTHSAAPFFAQPGTTYTPYRNSFTPSSSPFPSQSHTLHSSNSHLTPGPHEDDLMEMFITPDRNTNPRNEAEEEVRQRYEETNRLLAELDMVRRRRWGEGD